eukprot:15451860-Alexandrium_andersonii.AAC.1
MDARTRDSGARRSSEPAESQFLGPKPKLGSGLGAARGPLSASAYRIATNVSSASSSLQRFAA